MPSPVDAAILRKGEGMDSKYNFMCGVLGEEGARALRKAADRTGSLDSVLLPRTIISWLNLAGRFNYEGELPGVTNTYLAFSKSDSGYSGSISIDDSVYNFAGAGLLHVAAAIAVALGRDQEQADPRLKDLDLARLGKSIDLLAKAHLATVNLAKAEPPGPAAAPRAAEGPQEPAAPSKQPAQSKRPEPAGPAVTAPPVVKRAVKIPGLRSRIQVAKSESNVDCPHCGLRQFKGNVFRGCLCFRDLAKGVKVTETPTHFDLTFGANWDEDAIAVLLETLGVK